MPTVRMVRAELRKMWGRGFATSGLVVSGVFSVAVFLVMLVLHILRRWGAEASGTPVVTNVYDGVSVGAAELTGVWYVPVVQVILFAVFAETFAGEYRLGTWRTLLLRPVSRASILGAKAAACTAYLLAAVFGLALVGTALGLIPFGLTLEDPLGIGEPVPSFGARLGWLLAGAAALSLSLLPLMALAALLAVLTRSAALSLTFGLIALIVDFVFTVSAGTVGRVGPQLGVAGGPSPAAGELEMLERLATLTLHANRSFWTGHMNGWAWLAEAWPQALGTAAWTALLLGLALALFERQDIE